MMSPEPAFEGGPLAVDGGRTSTASSTARVAANIRRTRSPLTVVLVLAAVCGAALRSYFGAGGSLAGGASSATNAGERRTLAITDDPEWDKRVTAVTRTVWPECKQQRMNGVECKRFIDEIILNDFTGIDRLTRTIIKDKRRVMHEWYNAVVIYMDDDDMAVGRDGDGLIYYDFEWDGAGKLATAQQQKEIPPVIATEGPDGSLYVEDSPHLVVGCTIEGLMGGTDDNPIAGGVVVGNNVANTAEGDAKLQDAIDTGNAAEIESPGPRTLPPFDCEGLSGPSCCLLIKSLVKDSDIYDKAIQCHLNFVETTEKAKHFYRGRGKKVHVFTNHNFYVNRLPKIVGSWPEGAEESWPE